MKKTIISGLIVLGLSACGQVAANSDMAKQFQQLDHVEAVKQGNRWYKNDDKTVVRVLPDRVTAQFADGSSAEVAIPEDQFFLSIAPWMTFTHPCGNHVPTGCTGELKGKSMHLSAVDAHTGEEVLNKMVNTQHDGFIDLWVPSGRELAFTIHYGDDQGQYYEAKEVLPTQPDSRTCITTMQFKPMNHGQSQQADMKHHGHH